MKRKLLLVSDIYNCPVFRETERFSSDLSGSMGVVSNSRIIKEIFGYFIIISNIVYVSIQQYYSFIGKKSQGKKLLTLSGFFFLAF